MSHDDKDELARRLAAMSEGAPAPAEEPHHSSGHDHVDLNRPPAPPPPSPNTPRMIFPDELGAAAAPRPTPQPKPFVWAVPPPPSMPSPPASPSRGGSPVEVYYTPPTPGRPPVAQPSALTPVDDDAVIVPAPDQSVFAPRAAPRPPVYRHMVQTLAFKRTIIPILLTLGVLCPVLGLLGFLVPSTSPLSVLRGGWFSVPFVLIGLMNLAFAIVTMLQVKHELERQQREYGAADVR
jgi:hypothetical protein